MPWESPESWKKRNLKKKPKPLPFQPPVYATDPRGPQYTGLPTQPGAVIGHPNAAPTFVAPSPEASSRINPTGAGVFSTAAAPTSPASTDRTAGTTRTKSGKDDPRTDNWSGFADRYATDQDTQAQLWGDPGIVARDYMLDNGFSRGDPLTSRASDNAQDMETLFFMVNGRRAGSPKEIDDFVNWVASQTESAMTPGGSTYDGGFLLGQIFGAENGTPMSDIFKGDAGAQAQALAAYLEVATRGMGPDMQRAIANDANLQMQAYMDGQTKGTGSKAGTTAANDWLRTHGSGYYT